MRNIIPILFYGNIFYGLCALSLCIETNLQHQIALNGPHFYFLIFLGTVVFYSRIYYKSSGFNETDHRSLWYVKYRVAIKIFLLISIAIIILDSGFVMYKFHNAAAQLHLLQWGLMIIFPLAAALYTYKTVPFLKGKQLRGIGWLKPFVIGFAWSGLVTVYPLFFRQMQTGIPISAFKMPSGLFWLQNFLFISALAVIFDIKDYAADSRLRLRTYPAILGINKTIQCVIIPMAALSMFVLFLYLWQQQTSPMSIFIQTIPFVLLFGLMNHLKRKQNILFYLVWIDGLMLLKGICGIISNLLF